MLCSALRKCSVAPIAVWSVTDTENASLPDKLDEDALAMAPPHMAPPRGVCTTRPELKFRTKPDMCLASC